jgi:hypothetical protein
MYPQNGEPGPGSGGDGVGPGRGPERGRPPYPPQGGYQRTRYEETTYGPPRQPVRPDQDLMPPRPRVNAGRLWAGGVMAAVVVALLMIAGVAIARGIFGVRVPVPSASGTMSGFAYVALGVLAALVATALVHLLVLLAPRPLMFFGWIVFLCTVIAVLAPFQNSVFGSFSHIAMLSSKISVAAINVGAGVAIGTLLTGVARSSVLVRRRSGGSATTTTTQSWTS